MPVTKRIVRRKTSWMKKPSVWLGILAALLVLGVGLWLTRPKTIDPALVTGMSGDVANGEWVFNLGGCASCHLAPDDENPGKLLLSGGKVFPSPFGSYIAPNISSDATNGIGAWSATDLVNAMRFGTSPTGQHYYPAFPYPSYTRVKIENIVDLKAFLDTLPASNVASQPHQIPFPFNIRASLGGWKMLFLSSDWIANDDGFSNAAKRGRILVEGLGHCGECHTERGLLGNLDTSIWLKGAPNPSGKGRIPSLVPSKWTTADIAEYLKSGFTPDFDTAGAEMAEVVENTAKLSDEDRMAIAEYIKELTD